MRDARYISGVGREWNSGEGFTYRQLPTGKVGNRDLFSRPNRKNNYPSSLSVGADNHALSAKFPAVRTVEK